MLKVKDIINSEMLINEEALLLVKYLSRKDGMGTKDSIGELNVRIAKSGIIETCI